MKLTNRRSITTWIVSPVSRAPRPPAPAGQWRTAAPSKWPPRWTSVSPGSGSAVPPSHRTPLATPAHVLSFVLADGTGRRRPVGLGVLDPAGHADVARHRNGITPLSTQLVPS